MKILLTPNAYDDLTQILIYIEDRSPAGAHVVLLSINKTLDILCEQPNASQLTDYPLVHVKRLAKYPYKIFYRANTDIIEVLHIRHAARRPWRGL